MTSRYFLNFNELDLKGENRLINFLEYNLPKNILIIETKSRFDALTSDEMNKVVDYLDFIAFNKLKYAFENIVYGSKSDSKHLKEYANIQIAKNLNFAYRVIKNYANQQKINLQFLLNQEHISKVHKELKIDEFFDDVSKFNFFSTNEIQNFSDALYNLGDFFTYYQKICDKKFIKLDDRIHKIKKIYFKQISNGLVFDYSSRLSKDFLILAQQYLFLDYSDVDFIKKNYFKITNLKEWDY